MIAIATPAAILQILVTANAAQAITTLRTVDGKVNQSARNAEKQASKIGNAVRKGMLVGAGGIAAGLALSTRAAADFESHFAEVRKTVNTNARGFAVLEKGIRRMAKTIPITANELSDLAGQAGALGIRERDLLRFTRTAAELGIATDLSSSDAANALARLANIMGTTGKDFRRLGSTFVRLGNEGASTEDEIASMALRIAGAGHQIGLSEAQVMAYSSALSSVGINAEAGGSSISKVFVEIAQAVRAGRGKLDVLAATAGMSASAYAKAFRQDASMATLEFIEGLDRMRRSGGDVFGTLEKLKFGEIRVRDALLRASGAGRLFREQLKTANDEWRRNTALTREASQRYATASARLQVLKNRVTDWGISIGQRLLPHLTRMMDILSDDRLTSEEKFDRLAKMIGPLLSKGVETGVRIAGQAGPKIVGALATGMVTAWADMSPLAKLFTAGAILTAVGGRGALLKAGAVLGRVLGIGVGTGMAGSVATGAAGSTAAGGAAGFMAGTKGKLIGLARGGALLGVGAIMADSILSELGRQSQAKAPDILTSLKAQGGPTGVAGKAFGAVDKLPGISGFSDEQKAAQKLLPIMQQVLSGRRQLSQATINDIQKLSEALDLTKQQRAQYQRIIATLQQGSNLRIRVDAGMDPSALRKIKNGFDFLRSGVGASMGDILKVARRNSKLIADVMGANTAEGRKLTVQNMKAAANAIQVQMLRSGDYTKTGMERVKALIRGANLLDPSRKMAAQFGKGWAEGMDQSKEITRKGLQRMLAEARKMPGPMRKVALDTWLAQLDAARQNRRVTVKEFTDLRSRVASEFTGMRTASRDAAKIVPSNVAAMASEASDGLLILGNNTNSILSAFGARKLTFRLERPQRRQAGGMIVPGTGSGDKVPALLEPGEGIINRKAVAAMGGPQRIHQINAAIPRFGKSVERHQAGGIAGGSFNVDGAKPGFVPFMNYLNSLFGPIYVMSGLRPGSITTSGNVSNHASGNAVDISTMQNGLNMATDAASLNATGAAATRMDALYAHMARHIKLPGDFLWRTFTGGNHYNHIHRGITSAHADSAALMMQYISTLPKGGGFGQIERLLLGGPDGPLKDMGQQSLNMVREAANKHAMSASSVPMFGTGRVESIPHGAGKVVGASVFGGPSDPTTGYTGYRDNDLRGQDAYAELAMGTALGGLPYRHPLSISYNGRTIGAQKLDIGAGGDPIQGHSTDIDLWYETAAKLGINGLWKGLVTVSGLQEGGVAEMFQRGGVVGFGATGTGLGGALLAGRRGGPPDIMGAIDRTARIFRKPFGRRARNKQLHKTLGLIDDIGLSQGRQKQLTELSQRADIAAEFATRAGSLSYEMLYAERTPMLNADGSPVLGSDRRPLFFEPGDAMLDAERRPMTFFAQVAGKTEEGWTNERLQALFNLRNQLLDAEPIVRAEQMRVADLIERTRRRIAEVQAEIDRAAKARRRVQGQIRVAQRMVERMRKQLDAAREKFEAAGGDLRDLRGRPRKNAGRIAAGLARMEELRRMIFDLRERIGVGEANIRGWQDESFQIGQQQRVRDGVRGALQKVLGDDSSGLMGKQNRLREFYPTLLGSGSENFKGLATVQGLAAPMDVMGQLPEIGVLGGEIYDSQDILRTLARKPLPIPLVIDPPDTDTTSTRDDSERLGLLEQLLRESQQRAFVAERQFDVFRKMPMPGTTPFGGIFHSGGIVPGPSGQERSAIVRAGEGVFTREQMAVIGSRVATAGSQNVNVSVKVYEADGRVEVKVNEQDVAAIVERVTRRQARGAGRGLPGAGGGWGS